tara:strand:- start:22603 stop:23013 length:411 start_codon:yes stop_codon:yes gene_type:complete
MNIKTEYIEAREKYEAHLAAQVERLGAALPDGHKIEIGENLIRESYFVIKGEWTDSIYGVGKHQGEVFVLWGNSAWGRCSDALAAEATGSAFNCAPLRQVELFIEILAKATPTPMDKVEQEACLGDWEKERGEIKQ